MDAADVYGYTKGLLVNRIPYIRVYNGYHCIPLQYLKVGVWCDMLVCISALSTHSLTCPFCIL